MAGVLGRAFIQVFADLSKFTPGLREQIKKSLNEETKGLRFEELDKSAKKAGEDAADELAKGVDSKIENNMKKEGKKGGLALGHALGAAFSFAAAAFLPTIIGLAAELAAALAPAATALAATIPTAIAALVASAATLKLAFHGVGDALKLAFDPKNADQFNEAMKKLTPAARAFVMEIKNLHPVMHQLQQDVQQTFFVQLQGSLTRMVRNLVPALHNGLVQLAKDLGQMGRNLLNALGSRRSDLAAIFTAAHQAIKPFIPALAAVAGALITITAAAGPMVAALSGGFAQLLMEFSQFVATASKSGALAQFFSDALIVLRQFGALLGSVLRLVGDILVALQQTGGQGLSSLTRIVQMLDQFFSSAEGKQALAALFNLLNVALTTLFKVLTPLLPALGEMATTLSNGLADALIKLTPLLVAFSNWLAQHKEVLYVAIAAWTAYKLAVLAAAAAEGLADALNPVGAAIIGIALYVAWVVVLIKHWKLIEHEVLVVLNAMGSFFSGIWAWITGVGKAIGDWFTVTVPNFFTSLPGRIGAALAALPGLLGKLFLDALSAAGEAIGIGIGLVLVYFIKLPGMIWFELKTLATLFVDLFRLGLGAAKALIDGLVSSIVFVFTQLPGRVWAGIKALPGIIGGVFRDAWSWAKREVSQGADAVVNFVQRLPGRIRGFMSNVGHDILDGLKSGINAVISGFNRGIDRVAGFVHIGLPHLPYLAAGGLVKAPTLAVVGEAGPEAVIPMSSPQKAAQVAKSTGLLDILGSNMNKVGATLVQVYLGTKEITDILDVRIDHKLDDQAQALAYGTR